MKPFNLERALAGDPLVSRDGQPVKIRNVIIGDSYPLKVVYGNDYRHTDSANPKGRINGSVETCWDLFMAPKKVKKKLWLTVRLDPSDTCKIHYTSHAYQCKASAESLIPRSSEDLKLVEIEIEVDE